MSDGHVRWEDAASDDFVAELQSEQAFNDEEAGNTGATYRTSLANVDGAAGSDQFTSLDHAHASIYDDVNSAGTRSIQGMLDAGDTQRASRNNAIQQLNG
jgi:hypothetical protein